MPVVESERRADPNRAFLSGVPKMSRRTAYSLVLAPFVVMGIVAGCSGTDAGTTGDSGAPPASTTTPTTTSTPSTPATDAAAPDTSISDTGTPDAPVAFAPSQVAGLQLWLDPARGLTQAGAKVSAWADQSSAGNTVFQGNGDIQPSVGQAGSKPVLVFTAGTWLERDPATTKLDFGTDDVLVEVVVGLDSRTTALTGVLYKGLFPAPAFDGLQVFANISGDGKPGAGLDGDKLKLQGPTVLAADGKLHLIGYRRVGPRVSLRVDGAEVTTATSTARSVDSVSPLYVGGRQTGVHNAPNALGDILVFRGPVGDADVAKIEAYLKQKDGI